MTPKVEESGSNAKVHFQPKNEGLTKDQIKQVAEYENRIKSLFPSVVRIWPKDPPIAMEYHHGNIYEVVTIPDVSPSLAQMVKTGNVIPAGSSQFYEYDDLPDDDDQAHEMDDASIVARMDPAMKDAYVQEFVSNPDNYEKPKEEPKQEPKEGGEAKDSDKES